MVTVKQVFDKLGLPQSDHVRSYIGVLVSEHARCFQIKIEKVLEGGSLDDEGSYFVNAYPDDFEEEIKKYVLREPKQKRPRIKIRKVNG